MAETKRPCTDCDNVEPCDMLERCIKHDPAAPMFDNYTRLSTPDGTHVEHCPVCAAAPEVWQYIAKEGDGAQKVVMCSHDDDIGPHDALAGGGCPLYMPPQSFYRPTIREAVKHWNEYAKALNALRRKNAWQHAQVLRGDAGVSGRDGQTFPQQPPMGGTQDTEGERRAAFWCHERSHDRPRCGEQCDECAETAGPDTEGER